MVEENYASGEQTRISNELTKTNQRKSEIEKLHTTIMNEYRDKNSQLADAEAKENRSKSQSKSTMIN